jgi:hypothetical protein
LLILGKFEGQRKIISVRAGLYFGISAIAVWTHLGALLVTSIAISVGATELNPLSAILGPFAFQLLDFVLINACAILIWFLPIPQWAKTLDISFLAVSTSLDFARDLFIYYSR